MSDTGIREQRIGRLGFVSIGGLGFRVWLSDFADDEGVGQDAWESCKQRNT